MPNEYMKTLLTRLHIDIEILTDKLTANVQKFYYLASKYFLKFFQSLTGTLYIKVRCYRFITLAKNFRQKFLKIFRCFCASCTKRTF